MGTFTRIRAIYNGATSINGVHGADPVRRGTLIKVSAFPLLLLLAFGIGATETQAQSTFTITSATDGTSAAIPAGANGAVLNLAGTLPSAQQISNGTILACFYTGNGSVSALPLTAPTATTPEQLSVPASLIQAIPQSSFTATNGYSVTAFVYFANTDAGLCNGFSDSQLTNEYPVSIVAPSLGTYTGPVSVPQTNPSTNLQAAPLSLNIPASGFLASANTTGATTVTFGSFGSVTLAIPPTATSSINVPVPSAFSSSPVGTTASLSICNTLTGVDSPVCTSPTPAITLTVTALAASTGTITATPNPVLISGKTVLTAQFTKAANAGTAANLGAPSGTVSFTAPGATIASAPLVLDTTATFTSQTTTLTSPVAPTPIITPAAGSYTGAQSITITDSLTNAAIYYTQDGTTPTASSTLYTGPFSITASETVEAIAVVPGYLNSAVASAAYTITILPATQLAFTVQPSDTLLNTAISPAVQVALKDVNGTVVVNSTAAVSLALYSDPGNTSLGGTTTVNAVNGIATFPDLTVGVLGTGYSLQAHSGSLIPSTSQPFNVTPPAITLAVQSELVGINSTLNGTITLGAPAPAGGLVVTLTSGTPANVTVAPATITIAAGGTTGAFTYTGVAAGNSTLSASATGYTTGTVATTATAAQVSLGMIPNVAPAQMQSLALSLPTAAPPGGTTVTFTIANPNIATVTATSFIPAGAQTPAANPQVTGVLIGTTTVTASAPGYAPASRPVVVTVTAAFSPGTTNINLATATNTSLTISAPAPPGGITFTLSSDNPSIATVPSSITVVAGATSVPIAITGISAGSTTIRADSAGITEATGTVNVDSVIGNSTFITGYDLEEDTNLYLPVSPSVPTTVTVTVSDPTVAVISTSNTVAGQTTLTFPNTTSSYIGTIAVQGLKVGTTTITVSAPGYNAGTITVTVNPSGFVINGYQLAFSTTTYSGVYSLNVFPAILNSNLSYYTTSTLNPQSATISLPVTSSSPAIGTVTSPLVFPPHNTEQNISFQPVAAGTTNITLGTPPTGFSVGADHQQSVATVTTPVIVVNPYITAQKLQGSVNLYLPEPPPSAVTVTVTSSDPTKATISASDTVAGTGTLTYSVAAGQTFIGTIWYQGQALGNSTITVSADGGYTSGSNTVTVYPSGFYYIYTGNFSTTTFSGTTNLSVYTAALYPTTSNNPLALYTYGYELNPGVAPVTVPLSNSDPTVGTVAGGGVVFTAGKTGVSTTFQPSAAGTTNIAITTPSGFSTAAPAQTITATVTAPTMYNYDTYTGVKLQNNFTIGIPVSTPTPETVTITSSNAAIFTISSSETTAGTGSLTFTTTNGSGQSIWIQGQSAGTATLSVSAPGFTSSTSTITVYPSGFAFFGYYTPPYTTTTFSGQSAPSVGTITIGSSGSIYGYIGALPLNPGVTATVVITDGTPSVGTISSAALVFNAGDTSHSFNFQPVSAGTTNLALATPVGFTTPMSGNPSVPQNQSGIITVTAPAIQIYNVTTGVNLDGSLSISLPQTPPSNNGNGVTVTITSSSPTLATLSKDPTVVGTPSVVFTNVTSQNVGTIYVQGQALGTAQLTETASGYTDGNSTITVLPSGFSFYYNNTSFLTSVANGPYTLTAYPSALNTGTLTLNQYPLMLNPGLGNVTVPVASSNAAVGTVSSGPSFAPGASSATFQFVPVGTGTSTITLGTPAGYSTPSQNQTVTGTVQ
jgi:hypothetical protein